jgi:hypothetical protein
LLSRGIFILVDRTSCQDTEVQILTDDGITYEAAQIVYKFLQSIYPVQAGD